MAYTSSQSQRGALTQLSIGATPTPIFEIKNVQYSGFKNDMEDVTNLNSPGRYKEWQTTLIDAGDISLSGNLVPADPGQVAMIAALNSGTSAPFTIQYPKTGIQITGGDKETFAAFVSEFGKDIQATKVNQFTAKLKITGPVTFVAGT